MTELTEIKRAVESNRKAQVVENIPELLDENEKIREDTIPFTRLALAVLYLSRLTESSLGREEFETASEFNEVRDELLETNIQVSETLSEYVRGEATPDELIEKIDAFMRARDRYEETSQDLVEIQSDEVPGIISITGPQTDSVPKGGRYTERLSIKNMGGDRVSSISLEAGGDSQVSASVSPSTIDSIDQDGEASVSLVAETNVSGTFSITVSATSTDNSNQYSSDQYELRLSIFSKKDYIQRAISQTRNLRSSVPDTSSGSGNPGRGGGPPAGKGNRGSARGVNGLRSKLDNIEKALVSIEEQMDEGGSPSHNALNNKIDSVINKYGAFLNQVEALGNSGKITEFRSILLQQDGRGVVDTLENAKTAK